MQSKLESFEILIADNQKKESVQEFLIMRKRHSVDLKKYNELLNYFDKSNLKEE